MDLRLDEHYPLTWRDPWTIQLGIAEPVLVERPTLAEERMLSDLARGTSIARLETIAMTSGEARGAARRLVTRVARAIAPVSRPSATITIDGIGALADQVDDLVIALGHHSGDGADLAIVIADWQIPPATMQRHLSSDRPHLPVVIDDVGARIGPWIEPGRGPCLHCLYLHQCDADPSWPAISCQLLGREAPMDPVTASAVLHQVGRMVVARVRRSPGRPLEYRIDVAGTVTAVRRERHPQCLCSDLLALVPQSRR
jgi:stage V sporulation protein SpoVS